MNIHYIDGLEDLLRKSAVITIVRPHFLNLHGFGSVDIHLD